jgi:diguanylate cyclase (GGDEF)-like protein
MENKGLFFSLRWKLAILFGSVFLILHSFFSYSLYLKAIENFTVERENVQNSHIGIARTITEDSFLVLEQFAELLSSNPAFPDPDVEGAQLILPVLHDNWSQWQLSWGLENVTLFDRHAKRLRFWGNQIISGDTTVEQVLQDETPRHQLFCPDSCFQQVITPVMGKSATAGALSVIRSLADVIIKFKRATNADIGILVATETENRRWPLKLTGLTLLKKNLKVYEYIASQYEFDELLEHSKIVTLDQGIFEVRAFPIQPAAMATPPYFLLVDDITADYKQLHDDLKQVWLNGVLSLLLSLLLLILVLHLALHRIARLSSALPLLSKNQYGHFKKLISMKNLLTWGYDELDQLNHTAITLSGQLEDLEQEVRSNTFMLLEKSQDLAQQRDFVQRLFEVAPIIIMTQKLNGMVLTINQAGIDALESDNRSIIGKVFDAFLSDADSEHITKLNQLRVGDCFDRFEVDGTLLTESGAKREIAWLHTRIETNTHDEAIILTLGVDISERKATAEQILKMALFDDLTGLSNRRKFHQALADTLALAQRYDYQVALIYLDLDQFKVINDSCGHEAGDKLLKQVACELQNAMRSTDTLCRVGDDEFTLIIPHAELAGVDRIAKKINEVLKGTEFVCAEKKFKVSASLGIAIFPQHGLTVNELLVNADMAMYQAKATGPAHYHVFSPNSDYQTKLNKMLYWRDTIEEAIISDKFVLFYQPILDINTNTVSHYECLIRLRQDDGKILMPGAFIGPAEELGLVGQIDRLVLKKAVDKLITFQQQGKDFKLTVNLSGRSFNDTSIFEDISRLVTGSEIDPGKLIFEITETAAVSNFAAAEKLIDQIKALGCSLALDDFGVGFSSFYYLRHFPVDYVKIDGSFIRQIDTNQDDKVFVRALSEVSQAFGKKTVAEFVESEAILNTLKEFGIDYAQGYHIGKPQQLD